MSGQKSRMVFTQKGVDQQNAAYFEYIKKKSRVLYDLHISECGSEVLDFIGSFIESVMPERLGLIKNGYIAKWIENYLGNKISPQVDIIIYDKMVGLNLFFDPNGKIKIIPAEAVVGIFEIKRTLKASSLNEAIEQLREIVTSVCIKKNNSSKYLLGGVSIGDNLTGGHTYKANPFVGIISLASEKISSDCAQKIESEFLNFSDSGFLDMVLSLDGLLYTYVSKKNGGIAIATPRNEQKDKLDCRKLDLRSFQFKSPGFTPMEAWCVKKAIGVMAHWFHITTGVPFSPLKYMGEPFTFPDTGEICGLKLVVAIPPRRPVENVLYIWLDNLNLKFLIKLADKKEQGTIEQLDFLKYLEEVRSLAKIKYTIDRATRHAIISVWKQIYQPQMRFMQNM